MGHLSLRTAKPSKRILLNCLLNVRFDQPFFWYPIHDLDGQEQSTRVCFKGLLLCCKRLDSVIGYSPLRFHAPGARIIGFAPHCPALARILIGWEANPLPAFRHLVPSSLRASYSGRDANFLKLVSTVGRGAQHALFGAKRILWSSSSFPSLVSAELSVPSRTLRTARDNAGLVAHSPAGYTERHLGGVVQPSTMLS